METTTKETEMRREVQIDTAIAEAYTALIAAGHAVEQREVSILRYAGARQVKRGRRYEWTLTVTEAEVAVQQAIEGKDEHERFVFNGMWQGVSDLSGALAKLTAAREARDEARENYRKLNEQYEGWSRFFLVTQANGHIHSSMNCQTCNRNGSFTAFSWLPTLSGLGEEQAVAEHGAILCTVCFPSAPVEWTNGHEREDDSCKGEVDPETVTYAGYNNHYGEGRCSCGKWGRMTQNGKLRKHKPNKEES